MGIVLFTGHRKGHLANLGDLGETSTIGPTHLSWQKWGHGVGLADFSYPFYGRLFLLSAADHYFPGGE